MLDTMSDGLLDIVLNPTSTSGTPIYDYDGVL
jgi:hypothetical protein